MTLVNMNEEIIYQATIWHANKTYRVTSYSFKINGIKQDSLENPSNPKPSQVRERLQEVLNGKLIVGIGLLNDFESLDLAIGDFDAFWRLT